MKKIVYSSPKQPIKNFLKKFLIIILFSATYTSSSAITRYQHSHYSNDRGFSQTLVQDITQDNNGYLWFATWSGIYNFDGKTFTNNRAEQIDQQGERVINRFDQVFSDSFGQLWALSYSKTVYRFDVLGQKFNPVDCGSPIERIYKLSSDDFCFLDDENRIFRTRFLQHGEECQIEEYFRVSPADNVNGIVKDALDNVWIMTDVAIFKNRQIASDNAAFCCEETGEYMFFGSSDGKIIEFIHNDRIILDCGLKGDITTLAIVPETLEFLLGTASEGLHAFSHLNDVPLKIKGSESLGAAIHIVRNSESQLWLYSEGTDLYAYDSENKSLTPFSEPTRTAFVDKQGIVWTAPERGGIGKAVPENKSFSFIIPDGDGGDNNIRALMRSRDGIIYAGTMNGNVHLMDDKMNRLASWKAGDPVYTIAEYDGQIWIGTKGGGLLENPAEKSFDLPQFSPTRYQKADGFYDPNGDRVYCITPRENGRIWIATFDGSISYIESSDKERNFISKKNRISFPTDQLNRMRYITFSPDGRLFAGSRLGMFVCRQPDSEPENMVFESVPNLKEYDIQHILFAKDNDRMYVSSFGNGLLVFEDRNLNGDFKAITTENGLLSNFVFSAIEDNLGNIWISTAKGLNKYNPGTGSVISWSYERISPQILFNEGIPLSLDNGDILMNTNSGILRFNPNEISNSPFVPKMCIKALYISGKRVYPKQGATIKAINGDRLSMSFVAIDMRDQERVIYSYRVDNGGYTKLGSNNNLHFDKLRLGRHRLYLKATNADGIDTGCEYMLSFQVLPSLQKLIPWLMCLFIGIIAGIVGVAYYSKSRKKRPAETPPIGDLPPLSADKIAFINKFKEYLQANIDNAELSIEEMSAAMNMSRSSLFDRCKALLDAAPKEFLTQMRLSRSAEMIAEGKFSITQIAYKVGFNDPHYFSRAFKKRYGKSPREYKNSVEDIRSSKRQASEDTGSGEAVKTGGSQT